MSTITLLFMMITLNFYFFGLHPAVEDGFNGGGLFGRWKEDSGQTVKDGKTNKP